MNIIPLGFCSSVGKDHMCDCISNLCAHLENVYGVRGLLG